MERDGVDGDQMESGRIVLRAGSLAAIWRLAGMIIDGEVANWLTLSSPVSRPVTLWTAVEDVQHAAYLCERPRTVRRRWR